MKRRPHDEAMAELYRSDPALALEVINGVLEDGDQAELPTVLRQMARTFGADARSSAADEFSYR